MQILHSTEAKERKNANGEGKRESYPYNNGYGNSGGGGQ